MTSQRRRSSAQEFPSSSGKRPLEDSPQNVPADHVPQVLIERAALGELPQDQHTAVMARIEASDTARAAFESLKASNDEILASHPPAEMADAIRRRERVSRVEAQYAERKKARRSPFMTWGPALGAVAAVILAVVLVGPFQGPEKGEPMMGEPQKNSGQHTGEVTRDKGLEPRLILHRKTDQGSEALQQGQAAQAADLLQVKYIAAGHAHGVIISVDGAGAATLHFPDEAGGDTTLVRSGEVSLPHSYKLDDAPLFERFFFVTGERPIDVKEVLVAGERLAQDPQQAGQSPLELPEGLEQVSFSVKKVKP